MAPLPPDQIGLSPVAADAALLLHAPSVPAPQPTLQVAQSAEAPHLPHLPPPPPPAPPPQKPLDRQSQLGSAGLLDAEQVTKRSEAELVAAVLKDRVKEVKDRVKEESPRSGERSDEKRVEKTSSSPAAVAERGKEYARLLFQLLQDISLIQDPQQLIIDTLTGRYDSASAGELASKKQKREVSCLVEGENKQDKRHKAQLKQERAGTNALETPFGSSGSECPESGGSPTRKRPRVAGGCVERPVVDEEGEATPEEPPEESDATTASSSNEAEQQGLRATRWYGRKGEDGGKAKGKYYSILWDNRAAVPRERRAYGNAFFVAGNCSNCRTSETPQWRYIHREKFCNACYMRIKRWVRSHLGHKKIPSRARYDISPEDDLRYDKQAKEIVSVALSSLLDQS